MPAMTSTAAETDSVSTHPTLPDVEAAFLAINPYGILQYIWHGGSYDDIFTVKNHAQGIVVYDDFKVVSYNDDPNDYARLYVVMNNECQGLAIIPEKGYNHPGGMQRIGDYAVVSVENDEGKHGRSYIRFFKLSSLSPTNFVPTFLDAKIHATDRKCGAVGITDVLVEGERRYLIAAYDNGALTFYQSNGSDLEAPDIAFEILFETALHQTDFSEVCLFREVTGKVFMIGFHTINDIVDDFAVLFAVNRTERSVTALRTRQFYTRHPNLVGPTGVHFRFAATAQVGLVWTGKGTMARGFVITTGQRTFAANLLPGVPDYAINVFDASQSSLLSLFEDVKPRDAAKFRLRLEGSDVTLPRGAGTNPNHQQGIQKTHQGQFVVSGSANAKGYVYLTDADKKLVHCLTVPPEYPDYNHMGGIQVVGNVLAVGCEDTNAGSKGGSVVLFYDITDVRAPRLLDSRITRSNNNSTAGAVGLSVYENGWLAVVGNWDTQRLDFYRMRDSNLLEGRWDEQPFARWSKDTPLGGGSIDGSWSAYQNLNLFMDLQGTLWLIGMHSTTVGNEDWADLYKVKLTAKPSSSGSITHEVTLVKKAKKHFYRNGEGPRFRYGSGYYLDVTHMRFEVYSCSGHIDEIDGKHVSRCNAWD